MGLKKCPICGEKYADIYKRCPFCEEEQNPRKAKQPRRYDDYSTHRFSRQNRAYDYEDGYEDERSRPIYGEEEQHPSRRRGTEESCRGRRIREEGYDDNGYDEYDDGYDDYEDDDRGSPWFGVVMVILIAIIIACLLYLGRGFLADFFAGDDDDSSISSSDMIDDPHGSQGDPQPPEGDANAGVPPVTDTGTRPEPDPAEEQGNHEHSTTPTPVTGTLKLSAADVTIQGDETFRLTVENGGEVTYTSADPAIASVSSAGTVTGLKKGVTEIVVKRGGETAKCIVRVKSNGAGADSGASGSGSAAEPSETAKLNKEDITISPGEKAQLQVSGVTAALSWSVGKPSVATVDQNGVVTGVAAGKTTVTVKWDGQSRQCIVRVK